MTDLLYKATEFNALLRATHRAALGKRHNADVARFLVDAEHECLRLQRMLRIPVGESGSWQPSDVRTVAIKDPKPRLISVLPFEDRVVHHALMNVVSERMERYAIFDSYACRVDKGQVRAVRRAQRYSKANTWFLKLDIEQFFGSVDHVRLFAQVRKLVNDARWCERLEQIVDGPSATSRSGKGLAIGSLISQHMANLYLGRLDHWLKDELAIRFYLRYMDDMVVFGTRQELMELLPRIAEFVEGVLDLKLNKRVQRLAPVRDGLPFLGFRIYRNCIRIRPNRAKHVRGLVRQTAWELRHDRIGEDVAEARLSAVFAQLKHFDTYRFRRALLRQHAVDLDVGDLLPPAGQSGRVFQERREEHTYAQPQQDRPRQPQLQPGGASCQLDIMTGRFPVRESDEVGLRTGFQNHNVDPTHILRSMGLHRGTEAPSPGGGLVLRVGRRGLSDTGRAE